MMNPDAPFADDPQAPAAAGEQAPPRPEQPASDAAPSPANPSSLPLAYTAAAQARAAGYSWDEINDRFSAARSAATDAGYTDQEVDKAFGLSPSMAAGREPPPPGLEQLHVRPDTADNIRAFAHKYLTPYSEREGGANEVPQIHSVGDFARTLGWDVVDLGKVLGAPIVNGIAAVVEGLDGKPRSLADQARLGHEAQNVLALLATPMGFPTVAKTAAEAGGAAALKQAIPPLTEVLDAAAAVAKAHPEGITPETLTGAARTLGENFVQTGERPLDAAQRAVNDPAVMAQMHEHIDAGAREIDPDTMAQRDSLMRQQAELRAQANELSNPTKVSFDALDREEGAIRAALDAANPRSPDARGYRARLEAIQDRRAELQERQRTYGAPGYQVPDEVKQLRGKLADVDQQLRVIGPKIKAARDAAEQRGTILAGVGYKVAERPGFLGDAAGPELLTPEQHAAESAAAVREPGLIPDAPSRPALNPIPANDALANRPPSWESGTVDMNIGIPIPRLPNVAINVETIGQPNPVLADGLLTSFRRVFNPQGLSPEGAGVIRHHLADTQANRIRSVENLRRFGRAINDLPSADRRAWWHDYETGNLAPRWSGTAMETLGNELAAEFDRRYAEMNRLGIAPNYIENYLPRLYTNQGGTRAVFAKRPLEGTKTYTRQRVFEYLKDAEAAGMKLATDNPAEAALIRLHDMDRFITAHQIMDELETRKLGQWFKFGDRIPDGLSRIDDKIAQRPGGSFYAPDAIATMLNRHLSPGWSGEPIYDVLRSATSMVTTMKLMLSMFHPLYLGWSSMAEAFGLGLKQMARGGAMNLAEGAGQVLKFPIAPIEDFVNGRKIIDYAKTGHGPPQIATMYDAMIASGARFGRSEMYSSSAMGSFWDSIRGSISPASGKTTFPQELAAMLRNAPPVMIGKYQVAPGYLRAMVQMVPRVLDTLSDPIMGKLVPYMKAGALSRMLQEEMAAHPGMGLDDIRRVGGRFSDIIDNRIGEVVQDNLFWPTVLHHLNNIVFMAPQWFMGKLRLFTGAAADLAKGGFVEGPNGSKELSDNISYLIGGIAATLFAGGVYGYLKGTWKPDWTLRDYIAPPTGGYDRQGGDERIMLPSLWRDAYGWATDPQHELTNKVNGMWTLLYELATNTQFDGAAITDPAANWEQAKGDYSSFVAKELAPLAWSQKPAEETNIDTLTRILGAREAPFGIREPELAAGYEAKDTRKKLRKKARDDAREGN